MANQAVEISVLVPLKDEEPSLATLVDEIRESLSNPDRHDLSEQDWEIVLVDDGSSDGSWATIRRLAEQDTRVHGVRLRRNLGKSAAIGAGFLRSRGSLIVTIDADLQDDPAEIPAMVQLIQGEGVDLVAGWKVKRKDASRRRFASSVFNAVTRRVTGLSLRDHNCGLKAGRREVFEHLPMYGDMHRYFAAISHANGFLVAEHPVNHRPRRHGSTKFGAERYARGALDLLTVALLTRFDRRPGHLFGGIGLVIGGIGLAILLYLSLIRLVLGEAIGARPLLVLGMLLVLVAAQSLSLGILAEMQLSRDAPRAGLESRIAESTP